MKAYREWKKIQSDAVALGIGLRYYPSAVMMRGNRYVGQIYVDDEGYFVIDGSDERFETWERAVACAC